MTASRDPDKRTEAQNDRAERDHRVLADPDIRGSRQHRRGQYDDPRTASGNDPGRVERAWRREGRG